jgi:queuine/archaeosine tRNA-ribosyltransferase
MKGEECKIKPIDSLRWQEANADVGFNLDFPPTLGKVAEYKHFQWSLKESVKNFQLFQDERKNYNMKLLNVLHGETLELMDEWYNAIKDFKFDGWAVGMKPPYDPMIQAMGFMYLWEKGEFKKDSCKWLHFFGTSGKHVVPTIIYAASFLPDRIKVSYDSSSYNIGSIFRTYYLPFDIGPHLSFGEKFSLNKDLTSLPCSCPVCSKIKNISELNTKDIYAGTLISLHNMYQYIDYNNILNNLVKIKTHEHDEVDETGRKIRIKNHFVDYLN